MSYDLGVLSDDAILKRAAAILEARCVREGDVLSNPTDARRAVQLRTATLEHEIFGLVYLDNKHRVLGFEDLSAAPSTVVPCILARLRRPPYG